MTGPQDPYRGQPYPGGQPNPGGQPWQQPGPGQPMPPQGGQWVPPPNPQQGSFGGPPPQGGPVGGPPPGQWPGPPPQGGPVGGPPPGPPRRATGKIVALVLAGLVVLAGAGVGIAAAFGAFSNPSDEELVEKRLHALVAAHNNQDLDAYVKNYCAEEREDMREWIEDLELTSSDMFDGTLSDVKVESVEIDGDEATIEFRGTYTSDGDSEEDGGTLYMTLEDGSWLVCS